MPIEEVGQLFLQTFPENKTLGAEMDVGGSVLGDLVQTILDAERGILQREIEGRAALGGHPPDGVAPGHRYRQPESQP